MSLNFELDMNEAQRRIHKIFRKLLMSDNKPGWDYIVLEGFCFRCSSDEKHKYVYEVESTNPWRTKQMPNPNFNPNYKTPRKPRYCKNKISNICYENECPHLGLATADNVRVVEDDE